MGGKLDGASVIVTKWRIFTYCNKVANILSKIAKRDNCNLSFELDFLREIQQDVIFDAFD